MLPQRGRGPALSLPVTLVALILASSGLWSMRSVAGQSADIVDSFVNPDSESLNHLVVDEKTGQVFVGGVNKLFQFSPDLDLLAVKDTGAVENSTENVNHALVIDYFSSSLVYCDDLSPDTCTITDLYNISNVIQEVQKTDIANDVTLSSVPFIAPASINQSVMASPSFPVAYVYGFSSDGFKYSLAIQPTSTVPERDFASTLIQVCQDAGNANSHAEIAIECSNESTKYNLVQAAYFGKAGSDLARNLNITTQDDVLFAVFSKSKGTSNEPSSQSALCVYSYKAIKSKFPSNTQNCLFEDEETSSDYTSEGEGVITVSPVLTFDEHLTAVAATSTDDDTVVFLGTNDGHLKKVVVESAASAVNYGNVEVDSNSPVNSDMHFDPEANHLYVMTEQKVSKVSVKDCSKYHTCSECYNAKDPYCGWCALAKKCVPKTGCKFPNVPLIWLMYKTKQCPYIESVTPSFVGRTAPSTNLQIKMINIPSGLGRLNCYFRSTESRLIIPSTRRLGSNIINCPTPETWKLPYFLRNHGNRPIQLAIRWNKGGDLAVTDFTFYDCAVSTSCLECTNSTFTCDWCIGEHKCTANATEACPKDTGVFAAGNTGLISTSRIGTCPRTNANGSPEILMVAGTTKPISVKVEVFGQVIVQTRFLCRFVIEDRTFSLNAQLLGDTIYCDNTTVSYTSNAGYITVPITVLWAGGGRALENPDKIRLVIYKCENLANDCEKCLTLDAKYNCGWCETSKTCGMRDQCNTTGNAYVFFKRNDTCPK